MARNGKHSKRSADKGRRIGGQMDAGLKNDNRKADGEGEKKE